MSKIYPSSSFHYQLNKGLKEGNKVDLAGNSLNDVAHDVHIPALEERGVEVNLTPKT